MLYLLQDGIFGDHHKEKLVDSLDRLCLEYDFCRFFTFDGKRSIEYNTDRKDVFVFGAVALAHIAKEYGWIPGSMFNDNHDFNVYGKEYGNLMLNSDSIFIKFGDELPEDCPEMFFARPTKDSKFFTGQVFMKHSWNEMVESYREGVNGVKFDTDVDIMISSLKDIQYEVRCWIVGGKVVTMSQYKIGNRVHYLNYDDQDWLKEIVQSYVDIYQPAEAFVIDVCKIGGEIGNEIIKIVEINCLNCAGFYDANMQKLLMALEEHFNPME